MSKLSAKNRAAFRAALEDQGVPELYAYMASQEWNGVTEIEGRTASDLLWCGFSWAYTPQGHEFWRAIVDEMES